MITLLARMFIKEGEGDERQKYGVLCSIVGIFLNFLLFAGKYLAGTISGSIAVTADAFNNLSDAGSSFITLVGFRFAGKKPDTHHPFGHGRFEYISGLMVSFMILLMGFELGRNSIAKIFTPEPVDTGLMSIVILLCSIAVKLYMSFYNSSVGRKIDSGAMKAAAMDSLSDCAATTVVLISMLIMKYAHINVDGISGLLVAVFIIYAGYKAASETMSPLLGTAPEKEYVDRIQQIVMSHKEILGIHDLVVHDYGPGRRIISLHAEVAGDSDIFRIHDVIDNIEKELDSELECQAVIHMDPVETDNETVKALKEEVAEAVRELDSRITIHDFRIVKGDTHTNIIFDVVFPFDPEISENQMIEKIRAQIKGMSDKYCPVITVDHSYV